MKKFFLLFVLLVTSCSTYKEPSQGYIQNNNYLEVTGNIQNTEGQKIIEDLDRKPMFPNGKKGVAEYIGRNFRLPVTTEKIKGRVVVKFIIDNEGKVNYAEIVEGIHPQIDKEAIRVIKSMNNWIPAKIDERTVAVLYHQPIQF